MTEQNLEVVKQPVEQTIIESVPVVESQPKPQPFKPEPVYGEVVNCYKLNIRSSCSTRNLKNIKQVLNQGDKIEVLLDKPVSDKWVRVKLSDGSTGFTMKEFIKY